MDDADGVAVSAAAESVAAANVAQDAALSAIGTVAEAEAVAAKVNAETVVTAAEAAVTLANAQAAIATTEAAQVIQEAQTAIENNERTESWQDEAIRSLQTQSTALMEAVATLAISVGGVKMAITEMVSQQSTPATSEVVESTVETIPVATEQQTQTAASASVAAENPAPPTARQKRVLRFL